MQSIKIIHIHEGGIKRKVWEVYYSNPQKPIEPCKMMKFYSIRTMMKFVATTGGFHLTGNLA